MTRATTRAGAPTSPEVAEEIDYFVLSNRVLTKGAFSEAEERAVCLGIAGNRIAELWPKEDFSGGPIEQQARRLGKEIIDVGPRPIVPAYVNAHTHLALAPLRGITSLSARNGNVVTDVFFQVETHLRPEDVRVFSRMGAYESLLFGVAEVWDHYYFGDQVAEALAEVGLAGVVAPTLQDRAGPGVAELALQLEATEAIARSSRLADQGIRAAFGPHASDTVSDDLFRLVAEGAHRLQLPVHMHLAQSAEEMVAIGGRFPGGIGRGVLDLLGAARVLMAHGLYLDERDCQELARAGWVLGYCPHSQLQFGILSPVSAWLGAGGAIVLGTDCVASNDALDPARELPLLGGQASLVASFSVERQALAEGDSGQSEPLESRRRQELSRLSAADAEFLVDVGTGARLRALENESAHGIARGAWAHFLVLDPDHPALFPADDLKRTMAYGSVAPAIEWMVVAGRPIGRKAGLRAMLTSAEYQDTLNEARRRRDELLARARVAPHS